MSLPIMSMSLTVTEFLFFFTVCVYTWECVHRPEDNLWESALSCHYMGLGTELGGQAWWQVLYLLSLLLALLGPALKICWLNAQLSITDINPDRIFSKGEKVCVGSWLPW